MAEYYQFVDTAAVHHMKVYFDTVIKPQHDNEVTSLSLAYNRDCLLPEEKDVLYNFFGVGHFAKRAIDNPTFTKFLSKVYQYETNQNALVLQGLDKPVRQALLRVCVGLNNSGGGAVASQVLHELSDLGFRLMSPNESNGGLNARFAEACIFSGVTHAQTTQNICRWTVWDYKYVTEAGLGSYADEVKRLSLDFFARGDCMLISSVDSLQVLLRAGLYTSEVAYKFNDELFKLGVFGDAFYEEAKMIVLPGTFAYSKYGRRMTVTIMNEEYFI